MFNTELWTLHLLFLGNRNSAIEDKKKHSKKKHPLDVANKYVVFLIYCSSTRPHGKGTTDQYTIYTLLD